MSDTDKKSALRGKSMSVAAETIRDQVQFMVRRIPTLVAPEETSRKGQFNIIARLTGYPPRRVKDLWHGKVNKIPAYQEHTIRNAYGAALQKWKKSALDQLQVIEAEHENNLRAAADYSFARWERACDSGRGARDMGATTTAATEPD